MNNFWDEVRNNPFGVLGITANDNKYTITVINHHAKQIIVCDTVSEEEFPLIKQKDGFFQTTIPDVIDYKLKITYNHNQTLEDDPYKFSPILNDLDLYLFNEGKHYRVWEIMGAHHVIYNGVAGVRFAVWAPNAKSVRVIGDFNAWDPERYFMQRYGESGIWQIFIPHLKDGMVYKYSIEVAQNVLIDKADPYSFYSEHRPKTASIIYSSTYEWNDQSWMENRNTYINQALSIYECHLSSWIKSDEQDSINYRDIAAPLSEYLLEHGFTHIELMPVTEYPFDGSWGYQVTGYFAPTSRYGTPDDFMYFVDYLHQQGLGVIIDWVPSHFPVDSHGLVRFDGTALYEHEDPRQGWHYDWNTHIFNYGRNEVRQFLIGSALYWIEKFHIDGIRVDAVASMLYNDYSRNDGEWIPNQYGGRENLEAIYFLQTLNEQISKNFPNVITIAEESTSFPKVTAPVSEGGLGFTYKWNMGWMHDTLEYFSIDPLFRSYHHQQITFSLIYAFSENYILPFSHDEVVHGKGTLLSRMPGSDWEKCANLRLMFTYMWGHPGKKMIFHGQEWGAWQEWSESQSIDWDLNRHSLHHGLRLLIKDLNHLYRHSSPLFEIENQPQTFSWIDCDNKDSGLLTWIRWDSKGSGMLVVLNLNSVAKYNFKLEVPVKGTYYQLINTDKICYGGAGIDNDFCIVSETKSSENHLISINVGPLAGLMFRIEQ
ncbi:MAG: 1,4-alpha-glucan branching protein GlgB [Brevinema sp.]